VSVDIYVSRDKGITWELIADDIANSSTYTWVATPPGTNTGPEEVYTALIRVVAKDNANQEGTGIGPNFSIYDLVTSTLLSMFQSQPLGDGIELRWQFGQPELISAVELERSVAASGPWTAVAAELRREGLTTVAIDRGVEPGKTYYYRLVATMEGGVPVTFGPLMGSAGVSITDYVVAAAPNPSNGPTRVDFTVPRESAVQVSIIDVQGREVAVLASGRYQPGRYQATWSGRTDTGLAPNGIYFVRFQTPVRHVVRRLVLAR
jgi:hypothetical protein